MERTTDPSSQVLDLLADGVPLTLLLDLVLPLDSAGLYRAEPGDASWVHRAA
ncbi:MAG TPA: hypothetical protein VNE21_05785 [Mycobacteriales bacterium]|nr:hypothetical protein [Mycobacteriales bacterium]